MTELPQDALIERLRSVQVGVRPELEISRHVFGGEPAYVVRDPITFKSHQLSASDYQVFLAIDPDQVLSETFSQLVDDEMIDASQEEAFYRFVLTFSQMGLLSLPINDSRSLYSRFKRRRDQSRRLSIMKLLFLRVPLIQPDRFLERTCALVSPLFTRLGVASWFCLFAAAAVVVGAHWDDFRSPLGTLLTLQNLPLLWALLIGLKVVHEFGHAYACKYFGGRVQEMGAFFVILTPCAYVDASASWGFPNRWHRVYVALAGMYFESLVAIAAVWVWIMTPDGPLHSAAHHAVVLSTLVTIGFNINPLMKYDGYYVLSDLVGIPNLRNESQRQINQLAERLLFSEETEQTAQSNGSVWFLTIFGVLSSIYKVVVLLGIAAAIAMKIPAAGFAIALSYLVTSMVKSAAKIVARLRKVDSLYVRVRALSMLSGAAIFCAVVLGTFPLPGTSHTLGVLAQQHEQMVYAEASGFLVEATRREGEFVRANDVLCRLRNEEMVANLATKRLELAQLRVKLLGEAEERPTLAAATQERYEKIRHEILADEISLQGLAVASPIDGQITEADALRSIGKFVKQGEPIGEVRGGPWLVKTLVPAETLADAALNAGDSVSVRFAVNPSHNHQGRIRRISPAGSHEVNFAALSHLGGGTIPVAKDTMLAASPYFEVEISLQPHQDLAINGLTAWICYPHDRVSIGTHIVRTGLRMLDQFRLAR